MRQLIVGEGGRRCAFSYTGVGAGMRPAFAMIEFLWNATRGHRLRPWRSPYLRWRLETYTGRPAGTVGFADFWRLAASEPDQLRRFLAWLGEMKTLAESAHD